MNPGDYITIKTECVPKGLVPDKTAELLYKRKDGKWYAIQRPTDHRAGHPVLMSNQVILMQE